MCLFVEVPEKKFEDLTGKIENLKLENDEEYNSSSDSDSIVTDSDDSDSFVVVNMPARCVKRVQDDFKGTSTKDTCVRYEFIWYFPSNLSLIHI